MDGQDAELGKLASTTSLGVIYQGQEKESGAVVSLHEWFKLRVTGHTLRSSRNMFLIDTRYIENTNLSKLKRFLY